VPDGKPAFVQGTPNEPFYDVYVGNELVVIPRDGDNIFFALVVWLHAVKTTQKSKYYKAKIDDLLNLIKP
jgi:hypothetical protein